MYLAIEPFLMQKLLNLLPIVLNHAWILNTRLFKTIVYLNKQTGYVPEGTTDT
jgi:hypothetical protein